MCTQKDVDEINNVINAEIARVDKMPGIETALDKTGVRLVWVGLIHLLEEAKLTVPSDPALLEFERQFRIAEALYINYYNYMMECVCAEPDSANRAVLLVIYDCLTAIRQAIFAKTDHIHHPPKPVM